MKIFIIIPTYNEEGPIEKTIQLLEKVIGNLPHHSVYLLIYDSNSSDQTVSIVTKLQSKFDNIFLLTEEAKSGLGSAYIKAMTYVITNFDADLIFEFDADGSHQPHFIPEMVHAIENGADVVIGSRYVKGGKIDVDWAWNRRLISRVGNWVARLILSWKYKDVTSGFRVSKVSFLKKIELEKLLSKNYAYKIHLFWALLQLKAKIKEIPITFLDREQGISKFPKNNIIESLKIVLLLRIRKFRKDVLLLLNKTENSIWIQK